MHIRLRALVVVGIVAGCGVAQVQNVREPGKGPCTSARICGLPVEVLVVDRVERPSDN